MGTRVCVGAWLSERASERASERVCASVRACVRAVTIIDWRGLCKWMLGQQSTWSLPDVSAYGPAPVAFGSDAMRSLSL
eukprot:10306863-Alexandrium_andersonii.AAC.1